MKSQKISTVGFADLSLVEENGTIQRIYLDASLKSWIDLSRVPDLSAERFDKLWKLQPKENGKIKIYGKEIDVPRKQQAYMKSYWFSGMQHEALELPKDFKSFLETANASKYATATPFDEMLVNWYKDGNDYIGSHADNPKQHIYDEQYGFIVYSLTYHEPGNDRIFRIKPKSGGRDRIDIPLENGLLVVMGGDMQEHYKHQVPKTSKNCGKRINITLRQFK
uniref:Alkylated DNA repair dioxygenase n=1 Tax=Marseillevirus LCMAC102 TaxID=2506603 RepID=A0A481YUE9_9VIRU|nr:MAG: alkylated DNA repair dioxygenase [Marseillevirus LCMAC102]